MHRVKPYQVEPLVVHSNFSSSLSSKIYEGERWRTEGVYISSGEDWTSESETVEVAAFECVMELRSMTTTYGIVERGPFVYR